MMFSKLLGILIFGKQKEAPLERRILILITFYILLIAVAGNVVNISLNFNALLIATTAVALLIAFLFYLLARNSNNYSKAILPFVFVALIFLVAVWVLNGGYEGNTVNLIFVLFIGLYTIVPGRFRMLIFYVFLVLLTALIFLQHVYPKFVVPYDNAHQRFIDLFFGNLLYFILLFFVIRIIIKNYTLENQKVEAVNKTLNEKNKEILESSKKILETENRFRSIAEQIPDVIFLTGLDGKINYVSPATEKIFGWKPEEMEGKYFVQYLHEKDIQRAFSHFEETIKYNKTTNDLSLIIRRKDNSFRNIELNATTFVLDGKIEGAIGIIKDVTERLLVEEKIIKLSKGIEQSPASIIITDINGTIEYVNNKFTEVTGYSFDEAAGQTPRILKSGYHNQVFYENLWNSLLSGEEWRGEIYNQKKNGEKFWDFASIFPIKNEAGQITHFVALNEDISLRKQMEKELRLAKEKAEESDRLKSAFLANMSHEIRTPLNGILGFTSLLAKDNLSSEQKEKYAGIIKRSADGLLQIINDILDISKIESGQLEICKAPFNVNSLLRDLDFIYQAKLKEENRHDIQVKLHALEESLIMNTDEFRLRQIFINLIDNALKFTSNGYVHFGINGEMNSSVEFFVRDTGIGIPPEMHSQIFDRFAQVPAEGSNNRGNGLGLSIVKHLVEQMGGSISVDSQLGQGTTFIFNLPVGV